ncbi:crotonyl-CoA carboxylase/reductase [Saccharothrix yanglingensis]|uniref:Crotonyl-CoA carboxylase/reductase n=1 Tax=Saccharothrix yanglingensis TaxID=659496 RepID=A0ABU0X9W3_9PSEU|nr:crotonyl-CoA carboxylase/reductase [Saccharothrix yanglingensis]MDQ2588926.1 crotonyl-CoA carboxylase/reductase [Saccharothrix yanglingensis]
MSQSLYEIGEIPPLGEVPRQMYASLIRQERYGRPEDAFKVEAIDVPEVGRGQVLVMVMAAGINYNNVWAARGTPVDVIGMRQKTGRPEDFHIGGSEGAGVVWAVGENVRNVAVGDHVVISPAQWDETAEDLRLSRDPMGSKTLGAYGYEVNYGTFAQFALVDDYQLHPKPANLTWEAAACYMLTASTAYRQLVGWEPNVVRPGDPVLIWGGSGGLGSMAIQITKLRGGIPIAVISDDSRAEYCRSLGAAGVINRTEFDHWGRLPDIDDQAASKAWVKSVQGFGRRIWEILGERKAPKIVLEHSGENTVPTSVYLCDTLGMVVLCGGTSGYNGDVDLRHLWMRQKRFQGSHGANLRECREVTNLVAAGLLDPCLSACEEFEAVGKVHQLMADNAHPGGNMAVLVNAPRAGLTSLADDLTAVA